MAEVAAGGCPTPSKGFDSGEVGFICAAKAGHRFLLLEPGGGAETDCLDLGQVGQRRTGATFVAEEEVLAALPAFDDDGPFLEVLVGAADGRKGGNGNITLVEKAFKETLKFQAVIGGHVVAVVKDEFDFAFARLRQGGSRRCGRCRSGIEPGSAIGCDV